MFHGDWISHETSGGSKSNIWKNPQFGFVINSSDLIRNNECAVVICLMQKYARQKRAVFLKESAEDFINFRLLKVENDEIYRNFVKNKKPIDKEHLEKIGSNPFYINKREISLRFFLTKGAYIILPSQFDENIDGHFLIRIFTEVDSQT